MFPAPGNDEAVVEGALVVNVPLVVGAAAPVEYTEATVVGAGGGGAVLNGTETVGT